MAGFKSPLFLLGLSATGETAGFRSPLPVPPVAGGSADQAGFNSPLPVPPIGGGGIETAGFIGPLPVLNLGAGEPIIVEPEEERRRTSKNRINWKHVLQDDEDILTIIMVATHTIH